MTDAAATAGGFSDSAVGATVLRYKAPPAHWIEIEVVGEDDSPVPWLLFEVRLPNGERASGCLDADGWARVDGIEQGGRCEVCFPEFDRDVWHAVATLPAR